MTIYRISDSNSVVPTNHPGPDGVIITPTGSLYYPMVLDNTGGWTVTINGAAQAGITLNAGNDSVASTITVGRTAFVQGDVRLLSYSEVKNSGWIIGETAIELFNDVTHTITNSGTIIGSRFSISSTTGLSSDTVTNSGILNGDVALSGGDDHLFNSGRIFGNVDLSEGDDTYKESGRGIVIGTIDLGTGKDTFNGGASADTVIGGLDDDTVNLGGGNDFFQVTYASGANDGNDTVRGGAGLDTYDASTFSTSLIINLDKVAYNNGNIKANTAQDLATGGIDTIFEFENAYGGNDADVILGSGAGNVLSGNKGADQLYGYGGNDYLLGGDGSDNLVGGLGRDTLEGGGDKDFFIFTAIAESGRTAATRDMIIDFSRADGDQIDLHEIDAKPKIEGHNTFTFIDTKAFSHQAGELRDHAITDTDGKTVIARQVEADVNGDGKADFSILLAGIVAPLILQDFILM